MTQIPGENSKFWYEKLAWHYSGRSFFGRFYFWIRWRICPFQFMVNFLPNEGEMVEFGCGSGIFSNLAGFQNHKLNILGIDVNNEALYMARAAAPENANFSYEDVRWFNGRGRYDAVVMIDLLHHVEYKDQGDLMRAAWNALKPGGLLIVKDIDEYPKWRLLASWLHDTIQFHKPYFLSEYDIRSLLHGHTHARQDWGYVPDNILNSWDRFRIEGEHHIDRLWIPHVIYVARKPEAR